VSRQNFSLLNFKGKFARSEFFALPATIAVDWSIGRFSAQSFDRFISTYVLDLLSEENIDSLLSEAYRVLRTGGLLG
jgi:cyclopropane fatty-acyl-phospholipid synthase-like methyltransferase